MSPQAPTGVKRGGGLGLIALFVLTVLVFLCVIPEALWLPFGLYYDLNRLDNHDPWFRSKFANLIAEHIWVLVGPLLFTNVCWMIYVWYRFQTEGRQTPLPPISDEVRSHFPVRRPWNEGGSSTPDAAQEEDPAE
jgi:hypothetical protein